MTKEHDYKALLSSFDSCLIDDEDGAGYLFDLCQTHKEAFRDALKSKIREQSPDKPTVEA